MSLFLASTGPTTPGNFTLIRPLDLLCRKVEILPVNFFPLFFINTLRSAATQWMAIICIPDAAVVGKAATVDPVPRISIFLPVREGKDGSDKVRVWKESELEVKTPPSQGPPRTILDRPLDGDVTLHYIIL